MWPKRARSGSAPTWASTASTSTASCSGRASASRIFSARPGEMDDCVVAVSSEGQGAVMDHAYVDEHQVAELYLLGKLPPEEAARFEEHSMSCQECLDRLETAETLRLGLRMVAAHE